MRVPASAAALPLHSKRSDRREVAKGKYFHAPVRGTGGIVPLRHGQIRVAVSNRQYMISVEDRTFQPGAKMPCDQPLHHGHREGLQSCQQTHAEKAYLGEAVGQGSAKRNRFSLSIEPVNELLGEFHGSRLVFFALSGSSFSITTA